jgi:hypothetical protein
MEKAMRKSRVVFFIIVFCIILPCFTIIHAFEYLSEKINYVISPFGIAEYNDEGLTELNGKRVRLISFRSRLTGFDDLEKIYSDPVTLLPLRVERSVKFPLGEEYLVEEYTPGKNVLVITKFIDNKKVKEYNFKADGPIHNAITLPFYLRTLSNLTIGWSFTVRFPIKFKVTLTSIDDIKVPAGKFTAYHFTSTPKKFEIWISKDKYRIPVKIKGLGGYSYTMLMKNHYVKEAK